MSYLSTNYQPIITSSSNLTMNSVNVGAQYQSAYVTGTTGTLGWTGMNSAYSTNQMKFATNGSAFFTGAVSPNDGRFVLPNVSSLSSMISNNIFTVEMWLYPTMINSYTGSVGPSNSGSPSISNASQILFCSNSSAKCGFYTYLENNLNVTTYSWDQTSTTYGLYSSTTLLSSSYPYVLNSWNHIGISYDPTAGWRCWLNGYLRGKNKSIVTNTTSLVVGPDTANWMQQWSIGCYYQNGGAGTGPYYMGLNNAYMQQFRVSNIVRYSTATDTIGETYTLPTAAFVPDANTVYLNSFDKATGTDLSATQLTPGPTGTISMTSMAGINATGSIAVNAITLASDLYLKANYAPPQPGSIGYYVEILPPVPIILPIGGNYVATPFSIPLGGYLIQYNAHFGAGVSAVVTYISTCIATTAGDFLTTAIRQSVYSTIASQTVNVTELSAKPNASGTCFYYNSTSNPLTLFFNMRGGTNTIQCQYLTINYVRIC